MSLLTPSLIPGCFEIGPHVQNDCRGRFVKHYHAPTFEALGLESNYLEEFYSISHKNVIRGLHFQIPPFDHCKVAFCLQGEAWDVVLDLRVGSPMFGKFDIFKLSAEKANGIYIPPGLAHGFCSLSESTLMLYKSSSIHSPEHDMGVSWRSLNIPWPSVEYTISDRDKNFPLFQDFVSPFKFK
jgi:dTDP-4-dehydrorhamnose 3,5-epimerase